MLSDVEMELMRQRHTGGPDQLDRLFAIGRGFADNYENVCFTPPHLATITADTLIVLVIGNELE